MTNYWQTANWYIKDTSMIREILIMHGWRLKVSELRCLRTLSVCSALRFRIITLFFICGGTYGVLDQAWGTASLRFGALSTLRRRAIRFYLILEFSMWNLSSLSVRKLQYVFSFNVEAFKFQNWNLGLGLIDLTFSVQLSRRRRKTSISSSWSRVRCFSRPMDWSRFFDFTLCLSQTIYWTHCQTSSSSLVMNMMCCFVGLKDFVEDVGDIVYRL